MGSRGVFSSIIGFTPSILERLPEEVRVARSIDATLLQERIRRTPSLGLEYDLLELNL